MTSVFDGPQIQQLIKDKHFIGTMKRLQKNAWLSFIHIAKDLKIRKHRITPKLTRNSWRPTKRLIATCASRLIFCIAILLTAGKTTVSDGNGKRFNQHLKVIENGY